MGFHAFFKAAAIGFHNAFGTGIKRHTAFFKPTRAARLNAMVAGKAADLAFGFIGIKYLVELAGKLCQCPFLVASFDKFGLFLGVREVTPFCHFPLLSAASNTMVFNHRFYLCVGLISTKTMVKRHSQRLDGQLWVLFF